MECLRDVQYRLATLTIALVHVVFVRTCTCLGVVDALIAAAIDSSIAFIHRRGLRVVSF